jgi:hypothetical protein
MTGLNRAGFYRGQAPRLMTPVEMEIQDELQMAGVWISADHGRAAASRL